MIVDSNIVIYSIQPDYDALRRYLAVNQSVLQVSTITKAETLGYHKLTIDDFRQFEAFFRIVFSISLTDSIIDEAIRLRQQRKRSLADAIIAATASLYKLPILTNNTADFEDIVNLHVIPL